MRGQHAWLTLAPYRVRGWRGSRSRGDAPRAFDKAVFGRWAYSHPKRFLLGEGESHGRLILGWTKFVGGLWLFLGVYRILTGVFGSLAKRVVSTEFLLPPSSLASILRIEIESSKLPQPSRTQRCVLI